MSEKRDVEDHIIAWKICLQQWMRPEAQPGSYWEGGGNQK